MEWVTIEGATSLAFEASALGRRWRLTVCIDQARDFFFEATHCVEKNPPAVLTEHLIRFVSNWPCERHNGSCVAP